jgi:hypothetical protein
MLNAPRPFRLRSLTRIAQRVLAFSVAVLTTYLIGSVLATQVILARVAAMGLPVTLTDRLYATHHDLAGLARAYLPLLVLALGLALPLAGFLSRPRPKLRGFVYPVAGALAVVATHLVLRSLLGFNALAAVRDWHGLVLQGVAGWLGAYAYLIASGQARR